MTRIIPDEQIVQLRSGWDPIFLRLSKPTRLEPEEGRPRDKKKKKKHEIQSYKTFETKDKSPGKG